MKPNQIILILFLHFICPLSIWAQSNPDFLRSTGKIYSVVAVIVLLFLGLLYLIFRLDKKISEVEKQISNE